LKLLPACDQLQCTFCTRECTPSSGNFYHVRTSYVQLSVVLEDQHKLITVTVLSFLRTFCTTSDKITNTLFAKHGN